MSTKRIRWARARPRGRDFRAAIGSPILDAEPHGCPSTTISDPSPAGATRPPTKPPKPPRRPIRPASPPRCRPRRTPQQPSIKGWNVYVVDAHSLIFQVFHALPGNEQPARRAGRRRLRLRPRHASAHRAEAARRAHLRLRPARPARSATSSTTATRPTAAKCRRSSSARFPRSSRCSRPWRFPSLAARATRPTTCWPRSPGSATRAAPTASSSPATRIAGS